MEQEKKETKIDAGSLYELNKKLIQQKENLTEAELNSKKEIIKNYLKRTNYLYYMLLCHERRDYTLFNLNGTTVSENMIEIETSNILIDECFKNRGEIRAIDLTDEDAIEIWLSINGESYVYYLFPYDNGVIEV